MTREEAQKILKIWMVSSRGADGQRGYIEGWFDKDDVEAFSMAIEALKAPTESTNTPTNLTSKADAIDAINAWLNCASDTVIILPSSGRPTGKWVNREKCQVDEDAYEVATCSECGAEITIEYPYDNYCPNCGAKMNKMRADDEYGQ